MLKAVFFDVDDTLFSTSAFADAARRNAIAAMIAQGLDVDPELAYRELVEVVAEFSSNYDHHFDKLLRRLPAAACRGINPAILVAAGVIGYHETKWRDLRPFPGVPEALETLAATELRLGVITAGLEVKQAEKLVRLDLVRFFEKDGILITDQIGIGKPNPKLFQTAVSRFGVEPSEAIYVGDHPTHDIDPANAVGLGTIRLRADGRHARDEGRTRADHEFASWDELVPLVRAHYESRL